MTTSCYQEGVVTDCSIRTIIHFTVILGHVISDPLNVVQLEYNAEAMAYG